MKPTTKTCPICGTRFAPFGRQRYDKPECRAKAYRRRKRPPRSYRSFGPANNARSHSRPSPATNCIAASLARRRLTIHARGIGSGQSRRRVKFCATAKRVNFVTRSSKRLQSASESRRADSPTRTASQLKPNDQSNRRYTTKKRPDALRFRDASPRGSIPLTTFFRQSLRSLRAKVRASRICGA
jgi:hypothetical protein